MYFYLVNKYTGKKKNLPVDLASARDKPIRYFNWLLKTYYKDYVLKAAKE